MISWKEGEMTLLLSESSTSDGGVEAEISRAIKGLFSQREQQQLKEKNKPASWGLSCFKGLEASLVIGGGPRSKRRERERI